MHGDEKGYCVLISCLKPNMCLTTQATPRPNSISHSLTIDDIPSPLDDRVLFRFSAKGNQIYVWNSKLWGDVKSTGKALLVYHNHEYSFNNSEEM